MSDIYIFIGGPFHGQVLTLEKGQRTFCYHKMRLRAHEVVFPLDTTPDEKYEIKYYHYYEGHKPDLLGCEIKLRGFVHQDYKENPFPIILGMLLGRALAK
jgi:hypothetical protein